VSELALNEYQGAQAVARWVMVRASGVMCYQLETADGSTHVAISREHVWDAVGALLRYEGYVANNPGHLEAVELDEDLAAYFRVLMARGLRGDVWTWRDRLEVSK
jgi:hypothetical protein